MPLISGAQARRELEAFQAAQREGDPVPHAWDGTRPVYDGENIVTITWRGAWRIAIAHLAVGAILVAALVVLEVFARAAGFGGLR